MEQNWLQETAQKACRHYVHQFGWEISCPVSGSPSTSKINIDLLENRSQKQKTASILAKAFDTDSLLKNLGEAQMVISVLWKSRKWRSVTGAGGYTLLPPLQPLSSAPQRGMVDF